MARDGGRGEFVTTHNKQAKHVTTEFVFVPLFLYHKLSAVSLPRTLFTFPCFSSLLFYPSFSSVVLRVGNIEIGNIPLAPGLYPESTDANQSRSGMHSIGRYPIHTTLFSGAWSKQNCIRHKRGPVLFASRKSYGARMQEMLHKLYSGIRKSVYTSPCSLMC